MKTTKRFRTVSSIAATAIAGWAFTAPLSHAAPIATLSSEAPSDGNTNNHIGTIQAKVGDLLETVGSVAAEGGTGDANRHVTASVFNGKISTGVLNDPNGGDVNAPTASGIWGNNHFIEFDLDTSTNVRGYDISLIQIIQRGDHFRPGIHVAVSLRQVGGSYTPLIAPPDAGTGGNVNMYAITNDSGPLIASGIDGVRFDFSNTQGTISGWTWYRELDVVGEPTGSGPQITSFTGIGGGVWELQLLGNPGTGYEFRSSPILDFNPGTLVENLTTGVPAVGTIGGTNDSVLTTDSNGDATVRMTLAGPRNFVRAQEAPPPPPVTLLSENFDATTPGSLPAGWTTGTNPADNSSLTAWQLGTPANVGPVPPGVPLPSGANCVATNISGNYDDPPANTGDPHTDIWLRSPAINLGAATAGTLAFQQWTQIEDVSIDLDYGSVRILDASDNSVLATLEDRTIDGSTSGWEAYSKALPAEAFTAAAGTIKIEFRFEADDIDSFAGWYIDDVVVTVPGS